MSEERFSWCLIANVKREPQKVGDELKLGTKHFSPGTKLYLNPWWGDCDQIQCLGKHRGSARLVRMVIAQKRLGNFRVKKIFNPVIMKWIDPLAFPATDEERLRLEAIAKAMNERYGD